MATKKITLTELKSLVKNIVKEEQSKKKRVIKENKEDLIDFVVPQHYGIALITGDFSGLEDEDEEKLNEFIDDVQSKYGNANFMPGDEEDDDLGFMSRNDIDNLGGNMMRIFIRPDRPMQESIKPKTQKIKLSEVRQLVRKVIKEDSDYITKKKESIENISSTDTEINISIDGFKPILDYIKILKKSEGLKSMTLFKIGIDYTARDRDLSIKEITKDKIVFIDNSVLKLEKLIDFINSGSSDYHILISGNVYENPDYNENIRDEYEDPDAFYKYYQTRKNYILKTK